MKLHIVDRYILSMLVPARGNYVTLRVGEEVRNKLGFTAGEIEDYGLDDKNGTLTWREGLPIDLLKREDIPKDIDLSDSEARVCKFAQTLKTLDEEEALTAVHLPLYELFRVDEEE